MRRSSVLNLSRPSSTGLLMEHTTDDESDDEEMEMTFSLCYHRPFLFPLFLHSFLFSDECKAWHSNGTLMYFSNKNGRTSKERRRVLDSHSFHLSTEQTSSTNDRLVCAFMLAQNFNPTKKKK